MFKTERCTVKPFETIKEAKQFITMYNDLSERSEHDHLETRDELRKITEFRQNRFITYDKVNYMILNENNEFIGTIGFSRVDYFDVNIGYRLLKRKYRQKGYLSEILPAFIQYLFDTQPKITRLTLRAAKENVGSRKVAERAGFIHEGTLRKAYPYRGRMTDFECYSILREEYNKKDQ